jgi:hypothetical protein
MRLGRKLHGRKPPARPKTGHKECFTGCRRRIGDMVIGDLAAAVDGEFGWLVTVVVVVGATKLFGRKRRCVEVETAPPLILTRPLPQSLEVRSMAAEQKIARQRMRHLTARDIKPLPAMHIVHGTPSEPTPQEHGERSRDFALHVLALQMWHAGAKSALPRSMSGKRRASTRHDRE